MHTNTSITVKCTHTSKTWQASLFYYSLRDISLWEVSTSHNYCLKVILCVNIPGKKGASHMLSNMVHNHKCNVIITREYKDIF